MVPGLNLYGTVGHRFVSKILRSLYDSDDRFHPFAGHECGHNAFSESKILCNVVGYVGVLLITNWTGADGLLNLQTVRNIELSVSTFFISV